MRSALHGVDMKTTVEARTKREAILTAIEEYNRKKKIAALVDVVGTFDQFMTADELSRSRDSG